VTVGRGRIRLRSSHRSSRIALRVSHRRPALTSADPSWDPNGDERDRASLRGSKRTPRR
jgi:hypothetical protein